MAATNIFGKIEAIQRELTELQQALAPLMGVFGEGAPTRVTRPRAQRARSAAKKSAKSPSRRKLSPAIARLRKLQGQYMGVVRHLSASQKAAVKKVREAKGLPAAIAAAKKAAK